MQKQFFLLTKVIDVWAKSSGFCLFSESKRIRLEDPPHFFISQNS